MLSTDPNPAELSSILACGDVVVMVYEGEEEEEKKKKEGWV